METFTKTMRDLSKNLSKMEFTMPKGTNINLNFEQKVSDKKVVYFPSCISRSMGLNDISKEEKELFEVTVELLQKAGYQILFPQNLSNLMLWNAIFFKRI
jgi:D-lactate dehydrogenase